MFEDLISAERGADASHPVMAAKAAIHAFGMANGRHGLWLSEKVVDGGLRRNDDIHPVMPANAGIHDFGMNNNGRGVWPSQKVVDARFRGHDGSGELRRHGGSLDA